jgi:hypothetical protein
MRHPDQQFPVYTADLDESLTLVVGDAVQHVLQDIAVDFDAGSLLVEVGEGEYTQVWGARTSVPTDDTRWFDLLS